MVKRIFDPLGMQEPTSRAKKAAMAKATTNVTGHGGVRAGAGKPKSILIKRTQKAAERITSGVLIIGENGGELPPDATPLDVMVEAMRISYKLGGALSAFPYAVAAAPYLHARIASIELRNPAEVGAKGLSRVEVEFVDAVVQDVTPKDT